MYTKRNKIFICLSVIFLCILLYGIKYYVSHMKEVVTENAQLPDAIENYVPLNEEENVRYVVFTDIANGQEVDDIQSLYRLFLYSNQIDIEGIIANTSCFVPQIGDENVDLILDVIDRYEQVKSNLDVHSKGFPDASYLKSITTLGISEYGKKDGKGFAADYLKGNEGVDLFLSIIDKEDDRPIYIGLWGGANTLAQAIWEYDLSHSEEELNHMLSKLRIYGISDQDKACRWIRKKYGDRLFYVVTPSQISIFGSSDFCRAIWPGISSDNFTHGSEDGVKKGGFTGADFSLIDDDWIEQNIQQVSSYGAGYPLPGFITEGDSPSFMWIIPNGLNIPERPDYGGWGGRYIFYTPKKTGNAPKEYNNIWAVAYDSVTGHDGQIHTSPQATLWRWRDDFQSDFAARMQWTATSDYNMCSHPADIRNRWNDVSAKAGEKLTLGLDLDNKDNYEYEWISYSDIGQDDIEIEGKGNQAIVEVPADAVDGTNYHIVVRVRENKDISAVSYARFLISVE